MSQEQLELAYLRRVLVGILQVTIDDLTDEREFKTQSNREEQRRNKEDALQFIRSSAFDLLCDALNIPACRVRTKCLK